jgi:tryptophan 2,3-dioxygenase
MELPAEITDRLQQLATKYGTKVKDVEFYLDKLLHASYHNYWDYIQLDALLSLQKPLTTFPDENIFILYQQITELYFKLILQAIEQVCTTENCTELLFIRQLERINLYTSTLNNSFEIVVSGMDQDEFLQFRPSLAPSNAFQSKQFRQIEIWSTNLYPLTDHRQRENFTPHAKVDALFEHLYWRSGSLKEEGNEKSLTLLEFEKKYNEEFLELAQSTAHCNLWQCYKKLNPTGDNKKKIKALLRDYDHHFNVGWRQAHFRATFRMLLSSGKFKGASEATNWNQYLPPWKQRVVFYPSLWSQEELEHWGE